MTNDWELLIRFPECADINECLNRKICPENSVCQNTAGNFTCQCDGGFGGYLCTDIDECFSEDRCHANATCSNTEGSYVCSCNLGHRGDGKTCKVGKCDDRRCPADQQCISPTSTECQCKHGLRFDETAELCEDIDECLTGHKCHRNATCDNSRGSYNCICDKGYSGNSEKCSDVDECSTNVHMCDKNSTCTNNDGSYFCSCKTGFTDDLSGSCKDIDECTSRAHNCNQENKCQNTIGSYECKELGRNNHLIFRETIRTS